LKINKKIQLGKRGIDLIQTMVDDNDCFFHEIKQENGVGIDAIIELSNKGVLTGVNVAVQIKTGDSYIDYLNKKCTIPIGKHKNYWKNHALPVYGLACVLKNNCFYYVDIKNYIIVHEKEIDNGDIKSIQFNIALHNTITSKNFADLFAKHFFGMVPLLPFEKARQFVDSDFLVDICLGLDVLWVHHYEIEEAWNIFIETFRNNTQLKCWHKIVVFISDGTHNPDHWRSGKGYESRSKFASAIIQNFGKEDIIKLLSAVDEYESFQRGSFGESVDFAIREIPNKITHLVDIIEDDGIKERVRDNALFLFTCYDEKIFLDVSTKYNLPSRDMLQKQVKQYGIIYPYA